MNEIYLEKIISAELHLQRLDQALAALCQSYSRSQIQHWIKEGWVAVDGITEIKPRTKVHTGQHVVIQAPLIPQEVWSSENIPLDIIYEDQDLIIINKPAGLVVHPGAGNPQHTLVNALLHFDPNLAVVPRAGLVHRLDKNTSGLLVVARHLSAHHFLIKNMQLRNIQRDYETIVQGLVSKDGVVRTMMGRHPIHRTKMSVVDQGKPAVTHYRIIQRFRHHTHLRVQLETGRTHQIRVHMAHIKHPIIGDPEYGRKIVFPDLPKTLQDSLETFPRQALHAVQLTLPHPRTLEIMSWSSPLPNDMQWLLQQLQEDFDGQ